MGSIYVMAVIDGLLLLVVWLYKAALLFRHKQIYLIVLIQLNVVFLDTFSEQWLGQTK